MCKRSTSALVLMLLEGDLVLGLLKMWWSHPQHGRTAARAQLSMDCAHQQTTTLAAGLGHKQTHQLQAAPVAATQEQGR